MALGEWRAKAKCLDAHDLDHKDFLTYGGRGHTVVSEGLMAYCHVCPVWKECIDYALETDSQYGVWGGVIFTPNRKKMRRKIEVEYIRRNERLR